MKDWRPRYGTAASGQRRCKGFCLVLVTLFMKRRQKVTPQGGRILFTIREQAEKNLVELMGGTIEIDSTPLDYEMLVQQLLHYR